jgi:hypothetical protein
VSASASELRPRLVDRAAADLPPTANTIEDLYDGALDVIVVRGAVASTPLAGLASAVEQGEREPAWARPNAVMPPEDIQVLGTAATPTYSTPQGPTLEAYLETADWYEHAPLFERTFDPTAEITRAIARHAGGRPVDILHAANGRRFAPFTVRRLGEGKGIGLHHDLHTSLAMFRDLAPQLDTSTLLSYVVTLQGPERGGELCVYDLAPDTPNPPKLANGYQWDLPAVEAGFGSVKVQTQAGDLFMFASARCLHRVAPIEGPKARFTMGGFLALTKSRDRVLFWS